MFNWFKKISVAEKVAPESDVATAQGGDSIAPLATSESEALKNQGNAHLGNGQLDDAAECFRQAIALNPLYAEAHYNLGITLKELGQFNEAMGYYRRALEIKPDYAEAHYKLGNALNDLGQFNEAVASYRRALEIKPDYTYAHTNLGNALKELGQFNEAVASYRRALEIQPDFAEVHYNLGIALKELGQFNGAVASYRRALELKPDYAEAHSNLGNTLSGLGQLHNAMASYRRALQIKPDFADTHSNVIFNLDLAANVDMSELHGERKKWNEAHAAPLWQNPTHANDPNPTRRLRIGYVSADFKHHSAAKVFGGMLTQYDRSQFDVFAYSNFNGRYDQFTGLFRQSVTVWRNIVGSSDDAVAELIREDRIDILVDLSGHSSGNRLLVFARKPAPIQITAWGYATGTGMRAMDVFFTDPVMVPQQEKQYFTEEVRYLPSVVGAFFNEPFPDVSELPALSDGIITFGSLNRLAKVSAEAYRVWAEVMLAVPRSRLILKTGELDDAAVRERVVGHFTKVGVAADRIIMRGKTSWYEHVQAYNQIDIALDPFPHGGGVTALEGLMMGVPVITLRWPTVVGRLSASIMTTLGLTDWIAETQEQYVELAIQKATDLQSLAELRQQLRGIFTSSVMGDQVAYARAVEQEYRQLWREWCSPVEDYSDLR
jgi:protein O-GlcNAc transferase